MTDQNLIKRIEGEPEELHATISYLISFLQAWNEDYKTLSIAIYRSHLSLLERLEKVRDEINTLFCLDCSIRIEADASEIIEEKIRASLVQVFHELHRFFEDYCKVVIGDVGVNISVAEHWGIYRGHFKEESKWSKGQVLIPGYILGNGTVDFQPALKVVKEYRQYSTTLMERINTLKGEMLEMVEKNEYER